MTLETRTIALTPEQWRHVEALIEEDHASAAKTAASIDSELFPDSAMTYHMDAAFNIAILTAIRSATP